MGLVQGLRECELALFLFALFGFLRFEASLTASIIADLILEKRRHGGCERGV